MNLQNICATSTPFRVVLYLNYVYLSHYIVEYSDQKMHLGKQCENVKNEYFLFALGHCTPLNRSEQKKVFACNTYNNYSIFTIKAQIITAEVLRLCISL